MSSSPVERRRSALALVSTLLLLASHASAFSLSSLTSYASSRTFQPLLRRADENATVIPAAINIAPSQYWDGVDGKWSSFPLQVGTAAQNVRAFIGTSAFSTITVGAGGCEPVEAFGESCSNDRGFLFLPNESLTWVPNSIFQLGIEINLGLDTSARSGFDTITLGWQGSGGPTVQHSTVFSLEAQNFWIGIFGLNPAPSNFTTFVDPQPSFMQQLVNNNTIPSLTYGYTAGNQYRLNGVYGSLVLGGYDQNRFDATKNISIPFNDDVGREQLVNLKAITTDVGSPSNLLPDGDISLLIDSTVAQIWLPESACKAFESAFGITYDAYREYYIISDSLRSKLQESNPNVTFTLGSQANDATVDIVLPYSAFDLELRFPPDTNSSAYFPLKRAANTTQYTLGRTFLQEAYLISDYDNRNFTVAPCIWNSSKISTSSLKSILRSNETMNSASNSDSSSNTGAIAGGVVGGVLAIALIAGALIWFKRRKNQGEKKRLAELEATNSASSSSHHNNSQTDPNNGESKPIISSPMGGELAGDGQIHEAYAPHKQAPQEMDSSAYAAVDPNKHGYSEMGGGVGEFFQPAKGVPAEIRGGTPIYEMHGSDVQELPASTHRPSMEKR
ncbi:uncharacterized protein RCC_10530 [Ramularia collo-cygni]|uniref:Peptidase A1 domain-containing protein n=1 Tax=Ramularia collo-cygni TaxID=112498 RepID=A0A2D3VHJ9_9PEZI|nr:uncharacterized protein RCC_10530 [Ramularia collo-cygni]CZT24802.1 uncharacterized protein RCC_10530 [Ramularia collo-cygni]